MTGQGTSDFYALSSIARRFAVIAACATLFVMFCAANWRDVLRGLPEKAEQAYMQEDYERALQLYQEAQARNPDSDTLTYNLGNTLYKLGRYQDAAGQFGRILEKDSVAIAPQAIYNMGNSLFKMGQETQNQEFLNNALDAFKHSIIRDPSNEDSKYNYELTRRLIQQQEQQQNQDKQDKDKDQDQDQNKDQNQEGKDQQQDEQQQEQKDQQDKQEQQSQQQPAQQQQQEEQQPKPGEMSEQEAEKILQALIQMEKEAREQQDKKKQPATGAKGPDW
ncbi:tetratricopeptide repeat protein [Gemmatimonadota bacterium]